ncbi:retinol dehydrogenase 12 [Microdochium nivale]|nr:retinol dehydrogenase 12 [Microdochium nivale]
MFFSTPKFHPDSLPDLSGKTYIVTGATSGIGYHTAARLAEHGAHVYICARSQSKGETTASKIKSLYPGSLTSILTMNHGDLSTVVAAAEHFLALQQPLHGLVNNAGIMATPYAMTKDGYEEQWQTNYLAHWVFTRHLLPALRKTAAANSSVPGAVRIVNISSGSHFQAPKGGIAFADTSLGEASSGLARYGQSKLANVLHSKVLHEVYGPGGSATGQDGGKEGEIWVSAVHPGLVFTGLGDKANTVPGFLLTLLIWYMKLGAGVDADTGAWTSLFCVAGKQMMREQSGTYFQRVAQRGEESEDAKDLELARKLEEWTETEMQRGGWVQ